MKLRRFRPTGGVEHATRLPRLLPSLTVSDDPIDHLIRSADELGDYLVALSKREPRIRDDAQMQALVEDLYSAVIAAKETRGQ